MERQVTKGMDKHNMRPVVSVRVAKDSVFFGPGVMMIMEALEAAGAMKDACKKTGISYSKAWRILNEVERQLGYPVVSRQHGGLSGGGCMVTPAGREIMSKFREAEKRIHAYSELVFKELLAPLEAGFHEEFSSLSDALSVTKGDIITLTGAGGKTACLFRLGEEQQMGKVLLTTTTSMNYPGKGRVEAVYSEMDVGIPQLVPENGRTFLYGKRRPGDKCGPVPAEKIRAVSMGYDVTVIEADGSRRLPLKGYLASEPCIPDFASLNIGVASVGGIGKMADESWILRWGEFQQMVGIRSAEVINEQHIAKWISHPDGMFKGSCGRKVLFFNQIEKEEQMELVDKVVGSLEKHFRNQLFRIAAGSVKNSQYRVLWSQEDDR